MVLLEATTVVLEGEEVVVVVVKVKVVVVVATRRFRGTVASYLAATLGHTG